MQSFTDIIETYAQIDKGILAMTVEDYLSQDLSLIDDDDNFKRSVERNYVTIKKEMFTSDFWNFTRVHNYLLSEAINPNTGQFEKQMPPDFLMLIKGYDKHTRQSGYSIYDTSFITSRSAPSFINYVRYVYDNDTKILIPSYFKDYIAIKLAMKLLINARFQQTQTNKLDLELELYQVRKTALHQDNQLNPFTSGIDYAFSNMLNS